MKRELGEVILEREFDTRDADGNPGHVTLRVGKPQFVPPENRGTLRWGWYCPHQIVGLSYQGIDTAPGMDSVAALLLSLRMADAILKHRAAAEHKKITWLGEDDLGLLSLEASAEGRSEKEYLGVFEEIFDKFFEGFGTRQG